MKNSYGDFQDEAALDEAQAEPVDRPNEAAPAVYNFAERLRLMSERLTRLNQGVRERREKAEQLKQEMAEAIQSLSHELEEHRQTWKLVENNPAATSRRVFLQQEFHRIKECLWKTDLENLDQLLALERERDSLLLDYLQLKQAVELSKD